MAKRHKPLMEVLAEAEDRETETKKAEVFTSILKLLAQLKDGERRSVLRAACTFYSVELPAKEKYF